MDVTWCESVCIMYIECKMWLNVHLHPFEVDWWGGCHAMSCTCFLKFLFEKAEKTRLSKRRPSVALLQDFGNTQLVDAGWFWGKLHPKLLEHEPWIITDDFWPQSPSPGLGGCTSGCSTQRGGSRYGLASKGLTSRAPPWEFPMWLFFWLSPDTRCLYHLSHLYYCFPLSTNLYLFQCSRSWTRWLNGIQHAWVRRSGKCLWKQQQRELFDKRPRVGVATVFRQNMVAAI